MRGAQQVRSEPHRGISFMHSSSFQRVSYFGKNVQNEVYLLKENMSSTDMHDKFPGSIKNHDIELAVIPDSTGLVGRHEAGGFPRPRTGGHRKTQGNCEVYARAQKAVG
ncbi:hypothetical protein QYE76_033093 [Lolium multiflorum]|uniref:Uncharacterized protein n=1 Tax=Lolium multiflorum TaxID=4521 RepID=A0AAD8QUP2_LOLMU|nr:hypothetical protein QYE76_033093 [Lolium multiflorum]